MEGRITVVTVADKEVNRTCFPENETVPLSEQVKQTQSQDTSQGVCLRGFSSLLFCAIDCTLSTCQTHELRQRLLRGTVTFKIWSMDSKI